MFLPFPDVATEEVAIVGHAPESLVAHLPAGVCERRLVQIESLIAADPERALAILTAPVPASSIVGVA